MPQVMVTHRYHLLRAPEKQHHNSCLDIIAKAGETTRFGTLYLIDDDHMIKVGVADQHQIANRHGNLQTGNPRPLRVVTLCFFYSREVALVVETELKRRRAPRRASGGSEWFNVTRDELRKDVITAAHELALNQMRAAAAGAALIRPELATYFYGLLMFDIRDRRVTPELGRYVRDNRSRAERSRGYIRSAPDDLGGRPIRDQARFVGSGTTLRRHLERTPQSTFCVLRSRRAPRQSLISGLVEKSRRFDYITGSAHAPGVAFDFAKAFGHAEQART